MRILHVYRNYYPDPEGGVQEAIRQISRSTHPHGVESSVFCLSPQPKPTYLEDGVEAIWRSRSWAAPASCDLGGPEAWRLFARLAAQHDLIHYHYPWPFADILHLSARTATPAIMTYHSDIVRQAVLSRLYAPVMWRMLKAMKKVVATSPTYARTSPVLNDRRVRERVQVIPLGIADMTEVPSHEAPTGAPYFLFLGALRYYKGLETLLEAARKVDSRILIAGEGPRRSTLQEMANRLQLRNVKFLGQVTFEEKKRLLAGCHGFVLPSHIRSEAFGMVLVEAAMFGRPMVSCDIGSGTSFVNAHMETGMVVPPNDPESLANAMNMILKDGGLARRFGENARARYESLFSGPALGEAYIRLYREVLET